MRCPMAVEVIGGGLAGVEAAWQIARAGLEVVLHEMRPEVMTPAHRTGLLAELVCSNSLGSEHPHSAPGVLKAEMRLLGSVLLECAEEARVPAGRALAVDREAFARRVTERIESAARIRVVREEVRHLPEGLVVVATGPLTSPALVEELECLTGAGTLYFFDAASPIVTRESLDLDRMFWGSRYQPHSWDYLNAPLDEEAYLAFWGALVEAERHPRHDFEPEHLFEGCLPIEELARRGPDVLRFGPLKPVGLVDPRTGRMPYAVVQLRREDREGRLFNLVGFQTNLKWSEQRRVFRMIPGLERCEFVRYGVMHRNTYLCAPLVMEPTLLCRRRPSLLFAGQITGVEGYMESAATGILAGLNAARLARGLEPVVPPRDTVLGALCHYIAEARPDGFQPMNASWGILPPLEHRVRPRRRRREEMARRALGSMEVFLRTLANS